MPPIDTARAVEITRKADRTTYVLAAKGSLVGDGLILDRDVRATLGSDGAYVRSYRVDSRTLVPPHGWVPFLTVQRTLTSFVGSHYRHLCPDAEATDWQEPFLAAQVGDRYHTEWIIRQRGVPVMYVVAQVRAYDGTILSLSARRETDQWGSAAPLEPREALRRALAQCAAKLKPEQQPQALAMTWMHLPPVSGAAPMAYVTSIAWGCAPYMPYRCGVIVSASDGGLISDPVAHVPKEYTEWVDRSSPPGNLATGDDFPAWAGDTLLVVTGRPPEGIYPGQFIPPQLAILDASGAARYLTLHAEVGIQSCSCVGSLVLACSSDGAALLLDRETGRFRVHGTRQRPIMEASLTPGGDAFVFAAERRHGDKDIFYARIDRTGELGIASEKRLLRLDGEDCWPVVSRSGEWGYFGHREPLRETGQSALAPKWSICRVPAHNVETPATPPEILVTGLPEIRRITTLADDQRLLVWCGDETDIIDTVKRSRVPVVAMAPRDDDPAAGQPLQIEAPAASPDGTQLAFSATAVAGGKGGTVGRRVYVCGLDGSRVRRVSPAAWPPNGRIPFPSRE